PFGPRRADLPRRLAAWAGCRRAGGSVPSAAVTDVAITGPVVRPSQQLDCGLRRTTVARSPPRARHSDGLPLEVRRLAEIKVYGTRGCADCRRAKRLLDEHGIAYDWFDVETDPQSL